MLEEELRAEVTEKCAERRYLCHHTNDSRRDDDPAPGWPDCVIVGPGGIIFRELKSDEGRLSLAQIDAGRLIAWAGGSWNVWRPADLADGTIDRQLDALRRH